MLINPYVFAGDPYWANVSLLLHGDGVNGSKTIIDSSPTPKTVTAFGNAQITTVQSKFGGASIEFNGTNGYLSTPANVAYDFGLEDFTIELWAYFLSLNANRMLADKWNSGNSSGWQLYYRSTGSSLAFYGNNQVIAQDASSSRITTNTWYHLAASRSNGTLRLFANGSVVAQASDLTNYTNTRTFGIGTQLTTLTNYHHGYIDDFRITKGVARYTAAFTPPNTAFPNS